MPTPGSLSRQYQKQQDGKQDRSYTFPGTLGDGDGIVDVPGQPGTVSVTLLSEIVQCYAEPAIPRIPGLPVLVGFNATQPTLLQVLAVRAGGMDMAYGGNQIGTHHAQHEWPQADTVYVSDRQFLPLRLLIVPPWGVSIYPGFVWIGSVLHQIGTPAEPFSLYPYVPTDDGMTRLVWFTINTEGAIAVTVGDEVLQLALGVTTLPSFPADTEYILGAVRLFTGQTTISEAISGTDILDLRFPMWHRGGGGGGDFTAYIDGALAVTQTAVSFLCVRACTISKVYITLTQKTSATTTIVDVHLNGTTIFTNQANRPAYETGALSYAEGTPAITALELGDILTVDLDQVGGEDAGLVLCIAVTMTSTGGTGGATTLAELTDVDVTTTPPTDGQVLTWVDIDARWEPADGGGAGGGHIIQDETTPLTQRANLNFAGAGVTASDIPATDTTLVTIPGVTKQALYVFDGTLVVGSHALRIYNFLTTRTIVGVYLGVSSAPSGASILVDVHKDGTTIFTTQSNRPAIAAGSYYGGSTGMSVTSWATNSYLTVDIDQIGSGAAGANLVVYVLYE